MNNLFYNTMKSLRMSNWTPKGLLVALAAGLLLAACSCSADAPKSIEAPKLTDASQIDLPLLKYLPTDEDNRLIDKAIERYKVQCGQRFGVTLPVEDHYIDPAIPQRRYGLINRDEVEKYGYDLPPVPGQQKNNKEGDAISPKQALEDEVRVGKKPDGSRSTLKDAKGNPLPEGGCAQEAWDRVRGEVPFDYEDFPLRLMDEAMDLTEADPRHIEAEKDWSACMRKAGHEFEHVYESGDSVRKKDFETQRTMALLEVDCAQEANYPGRAMAIDIEYQRKLIKENEAGLRDALDKKNKLVANAKKALK